MDDNAEFAQSLQNFNEEYMKQCENIYQKDGLKKLYEQVKEDCDAWKNVRMNIGVVGNAGNGKSSFINAIRGLRNGDDKAAPTGVTECTVDPTPYEHPQNANIILWDLPGVGTTKFPKHTYLDQINFSQFDFFIIVGAVRFREEDTWLVANAKNHGKKAYFVRTKVHIDVDNEEYDLREQFNLGKCLEKIRKSCVEQLDTQNVKLFLIDNHHLKLYDFDELQSTLISEGTDLMKTVFVSTLKCAGKKALKSKRDVLKSLIPKHAFISTCANIIPIGGLFIDYKKLDEYMKHYRQCFNLDEESLHIMTSPSTVSAVTGAVSPQTLGPVALLSAMAFVNRFPALLASNMANTAVKAMPILGIVAGVASSYVTCHWCLTSYVDNLYDHSMKMLSGLSNTLQQGLIQND